MSHAFFKTILLHLYCKCANHFLPGRVPGRKYISGCKCGICSPMANKLCAQQTAKTGGKARRGFSTSSNPLCEYHRGDRAYVAQSSGNRVCLQYWMMDLLVTMPMNASLSSTTGTKFWVEARSMRSCMEVVTRTGTLSFLREISVILWASA